MGFNRNHYSQVPLMNMKKANRERGSEPPVLEEPEAPKPARRFSILQLLLSVLLPLLFIAALLFPVPVLRYVFLGLALISVLAMWVLGAFISDARRTLTLIYLALAVVIGAALFIQSGGTKKTATRVNASDAFSQGSAIDAPSLSALTAADATETPAPEATEVLVSAAQQRLMEFMEAWSRSDTSAMLSYCKPSWVSEQENPEAKLFTQLSLGINRPLGYSIEQLYGSEADAMRTIQLVVQISQGNTTVAKRYMIIMNRTNDVWYVDPDSLSSVGTVEDADEYFGQVDNLITKATPSPTPVATVDPSLVLYYNTSGGQKYHLDPYCSSVAKEYQPLTGTFTYAEINNTRYKVLDRCSRCNAPERE